MAKKYLDNLPQLPVPAEPNLPGTATPRSVMTKCADLDLELRAFEKACFPENQFAPRIPPDYYLRVDVAHGRKVLDNLDELRRRFNAVHRPTEKQELGAAVLRLVTSCNRQTHIRLGTLTDSYCRIFSEMRPAPTVFALARATDYLVEKGVWLPDERVTKLVRRFTRRGDYWAELLRDEAGLTEQIRTAERVQAEYRKTAKQRKQQRYARIRQQIEERRKEFGGLAIGILPQGWQEVMSEKELDASWNPAMLGRIVGGDDE